MNSATFLAQFPEFSETSPVLIQSALARAARWVDVSVWGAQADDGVAYMAAHLLVTSPFGMNTRLKVPAGGDQTFGTSTYGLHFLTMRDAVTSGFVVAGGSRSW